MALSLSLAIAGCGTPPRSPPPSPPPVAAAPALAIDPLPGTITELEAIAADPASGERGAAALERLAAILHAESALAGATSTPLDTAAAQALRRLFVRLPAAATADGETIRARITPRLVAALDASSASAEADALRRHLACPARFAYAPGPGGAPAQVDPLPQDHDRAYWDRWEALHPRPLDLPPPARAKADREPPFVAQPGGPSSLGADTRYVPLYAACPDDADPAHAERRATAWLEVARAHRARDARGGPFAVLREIEAYERAIRAASGAPRGPAMRHAHLELGVALSADARYHAAATELVRALTLCEDSGACAPAERELALRVLAESFTYVDYEGPPPDAPAIERPDVFDLEPRWDVVGLKLRVAIERAVEPALVPKERAFAPDLLAALAQTFDELGLLDEAVLAFEALRQRYPTHRELPRVVSAIAREHVKAARRERPRNATARWLRAFAAWEEVGALLRPSSPWRVANAADRDALEAAVERSNEAFAEAASTLEGLVGALGAVAGSDLPLPMDDATAAEWFLRATNIWKTRAHVGPPGVPARVALASIARSELTWLVRANAAIDPARWTEAFAAGVAARDDPDTKARRPAALALVELTDLRIRYEEKRFATSHGKEGFAARAHALGEPLRIRPEEPLPKAIEDAVRARDGAAIASEGASFDLLTSAAGLLLAYGHTAEAERRLSLLVSRTCRERGGFAAFVLAARLARAAKHDAELANLAALHADPTTTCAKSPADLAQGRALTR